MSDLVYYDPKKTGVRDAVERCGLAMGPITGTAWGRRLYDGEKVVFDGSQFEIFDFLKANYGLTPKAGA